MAYETEMTRDELIAEIKALRKILADVAKDCDWREINSLQTGIKPIKIHTYNQLTSAIWGDAGCPARQS